MPPADKLPWYEITNINEVDSPSLVIYPDRVKENIQHAIDLVGDVQRLRPHVKTHKSPDVTRMMLDAGITKFKCATIAEAEMLALTGAPDVLLAYPLTGPKVNRWIELIKQYPSVKFSCLLDDHNAAIHIDKLAGKDGLKILVLIDVNIGMNRTGIAPEKVVNLFERLSGLTSIKPVGLHAYDGHITESDLYQRTKQCNEAFDQVEKIKKSLSGLGYKDLLIVTGGSPTFPVHAKRNHVECSPGTFVFWDATYLELYPEQPFQPAALVVSRIISRPDDHMLCTDLGHKSVAAENPLKRRVKFINAPAFEFISQSEEHLVLKESHNVSWSVGDVLYGLPMHICPTCALYERAFICNNNKVTGEWKITARDRKIKI